MNLSDGWMMIRQSYSHRLSTGECDGLFGLELNLAAFCGMNEDLQGDCALLSYKIYCCYKIYCVVQNSFYGIPKSCQ